MEEIQGGVLIPVSILVAVIGWLIVDKVKTQAKKDTEQDSRLDRLTEAINQINKLLYEHQRDISWLMKGQHD